MVRITIARGTMAEKEYKYFPGAKREGGVSFVSSLSSTPKKIYSWSNLRYVLRKSNVKRSHPGYWTLSASRGNPLFPDFRIGQNAKRQKGAAFLSRSKIEAERKRVVGECKKACAPRFFGRGKTKGDGGSACSNPLAVDSPQTRLHSCLLEFASSFPFKASPFRICRRD